MDSIEAGENCTCFELAVLLGFCLFESDMAFTLYNPNLLTRQVI